MSFAASLAFYGFQVSIIADISIRYSLGMRTIYIIGLLYGIMEEGFSIFTMESTATHTLWLSVYGLNATWTVYVMILHAVITVSTPLLVLRALWPRRIMKPFLGRRSYAFMIPVTAAIYPFLMISSIESGRVPEIMPIIFLIVISLLILAAAWISSKRGVQLSKYHGGHAASGFLPLAAGMIIPFLVGNRIPYLLLPETLLLVLLLFYFYRYFSALDADSAVGKRELWAIFTSFYMVMIAGGLFNRTVISDMVGIAAVVAIAVFGHYRTRAS